MDELILMESNDVETYSLAVSELLLRKALHEHGYSSSLEFPWFGDISIDSWEIMDLGEDVFKIVFEHLGYSVVVPKEHCYLKKDVYKIVLPELDGWSAQRLDRYRESWEKVFKKDMHFTSSISFFTKNGKTVLRLEKDGFSIRCLLLDMAAIVTNFLAWKTAAEEVLLIGAARRVA